MPNHEIPSEMKNHPYPVLRELSTSKGTLKYYSLKQLEEQGHQISKLPFSIRILLENVLRNYDDFAVKKENIDSLLGWKPQPGAHDVPFKPARVLMQDFTGVPGVVDLASLRDEARRQGKDPNRINPLIPVDLVIDHSVQVDYFGTNYAYRKNVEEEYRRNEERYKLLKWAQKAFDNFSVVPPGMGICHQVNLEYLAKGVVDRDGYAFPDTLVGTDSHTPMVNGIGVVGWGVGGIEAEAAILGQPINFLMPEVIGLKLNGKLPVGTTATDLVLTVTHLLRQHGVVGKFVEVFGPGLNNLSVPDRATISNMSPEFGCTVTYFPIDDQTLRYMATTNRSAEQIQLVEDYCKANMLWHENDHMIVYSSVVELDLGDVRPTVAGPKRPQDKILLKDLNATFKRLLEEVHGRSYIMPDDRILDSEERQIQRWKSEGGGGTHRMSYPVDLPKDVSDVEKDVHIGTADRAGLKTVSIGFGNEEFTLSDGSVVIAAITSCTNTSNPSVMIGAGLVARKARERGLDVKPWVKTSLAPGSKVVTDYLEKANLLSDLEALRFHLVGYGCTSCIGNSGPLPPPIAKAVDDNDLVVASVLSGNRNFEARVHPQVKMNFLMSPMLVVALALAGRVDIDFEESPLGYDPNFKPVYLKDVWPTTEEIFDIMREVVSPADFKKNYDEIFEGNEQWKQLQAPTSQSYEWDDSSTYIKEVPFFKNLPDDPEPLQDIRGAYALLKLGDSITTDHISPAGSFSTDSAAGQYLAERGVERRNFNSYGSRRGNDEVMTRGTFANVRIKNELATREGGYTRHIPSGEEMTVYDASLRYKQDNTPLVVLVGKEYGSGSSRDWAAKGTYLLGVRAVLAESYERIHRSNLIGMGVLPLVYADGRTAADLGLRGDEVFDITGVADGLEPNKRVRVTARKANGDEVAFDAIARLDSDIEIEYFRHGGILQYVLRRFLNE